MNYDAMKLLIVDDMSTLRKIVIRSCKELGFQNFTEAADGAAAWQAISDAKPAFDLIISDWNMPVSTGLDLLKRVRSDSRFKDTPFILLTAESEASQVQEAIKAGVSTYIVKPSTTENLGAKIPEVLQRAKKG